MRARLAPMVQCILRPCGGGDCLDQTKITDPELLQAERVEGLLRTSDNELFPLFGFPIHQLELPETTSGWSGMPPFALSCPTTALFSIR